MSQRAVVDVYMIEHNVIAANEMQCLPMKTNQNRYMIEHKVVSKQPLLSLFFFILQIMKIRKKLARTYIGSFNATGGLNRKHVRTRLDDNGYK